MNPPRGLFTLVGLLSLSLLLACSTEEEPREEDLSTALINSTNQRAIAAAQCGEAVAAIERGFGAPGPYGVERIEFANPSHAGRHVTGFLPRGVEPPSPTVLFAHANGAEDPDDYRRLISHLVSRGNAVIYASYMIPFDRVDERYDALWTGIAEAAARHGERLDLARIGLVGHSFGAGALPWLAQRATLEGWGAEGAFLLAMAPWYPLRMTDADLAALPAHLKALVLVFEDDRVNDHRIAIDLYGKLGMPESEKDYLVVRSDRSDGCELPARHSVPQSRGLAATDDALDAHAIARLVDALAAVAFEDDAAGRVTALGKGSDEQVAMGRWREGRPVKPLLWRMVPEASKPEAEYLFEQGESEGWKAYREEAGAKPPGGGRESASPRLD